MKVQAPEIFKYSKEIQNEARKRLHKKMENENLNWTTKLEQFNDLYVLNRFTFENGLPKIEFLKRLVNIRPYVRGIKEIETFENMIDSAFRRINTYGNDTVGIESKVIEINRIMEIIEVKASHKKIIEWIEKNDITIGVPLLDCLTNDSMYLVCETCYLAVNLIRFRREQLPLFVNLAIVKGCLDAISLRFKDHEEYLNFYRKERLMHEDFELLQGKELPFHIKKFECKNKCRELRALHCAFYTLCFVFEYCLDPILLVFFQNRIYFRREITRYHLFNLYYVILQRLNPDDIRDNEDLMKLPFKLYTDLTKALNEPNQLIKAKLMEIVHLLDSISPTRFPSVNIHHSMEFHKAKDNMENRTIKIHSVDAQKPVINLYDVNIEYATLLIENDIHHRESLGLGALQQVDMKGKRSVASQL